MNTEYKKAWVMTRTFQAENGKDISTVHGVFLDKDLAQERHRDCVSMLAQQLEDEDFYTFVEARCEAGRQIQLKETVIFED